MRAGRLRHVVTVQQQSATKDTFGGVTDTWTDVATVHADIEPLSGREYFAAQQFNSEITHKIRLRYIPGLTPKMRLKFIDRFFDVDQVINPNERNRELEVYATERL